MTTAAPYKVTTPFGIVEADTLDDLTAKAKQAEKDWKKEQQRINSANVKASELARADAYHLMRARLLGQSMPMYDRTPVPSFRADQLPEALPPAYVVLHADRCHRIHATTRHGHGVCDLYEATCVECLIDSSGSVRGLFLSDNYFPANPERLKVAAAVDGVLCLIGVPGVTESDFAAIEWSA